MQLVDGHHDRVDILLDSSLNQSLDVFVPFRDHSCESQA